MVEYKAYTLSGHLWLPTPRAPEFEYTRQVEDALARFRVQVHVRPAEHEVPTTASLDTHLDNYVPPWLCVDQMWADKFMARAQTGVEKLMYQRLLRSHYQCRYNNKVK